MIPGPNPGRQFAEQIIQSIADDPEFRKAILDDPEAALAKAGLLEDFQSLDAAAAAPCDINCTRTCGYRSCGSNSCFRSCLSSSALVFLDRDFLRGGGDVVNPR